MKITNTYLTEDTQARQTRLAAIYRQILLLLASGGEGRLL